MSNTKRPCHSQLDADGDLLDHLWIKGFPDCAACGWTECAMACNTLVPDLNTRCEFCHPLACPCEECRDCECAGCVAAGLVDEDSDAPEVDRYGNVLVEDDGSEDRQRDPEMERLPAEDSDGVPVPVSDHDTSAVRTVRVENVATGQLVAEWIDRLYSQEAA